MKEIRKYLQERANELSNDITKNDVSSDELAMAVGKITIVSELYSRTIEKDDFGLSALAYLKGIIVAMENERFNMEDDDYKNFPSSLRFRWFDGRISEIVSVLDMAGVDHSNVTKYYMEKYKK